MESIDKYNNYNLTDFILDDDFRKWTLSPDADADLFWIGWMNRHPEKEAMIGEAKEIVLALKVEEPVVTDFEIDAIIAATAARLDNERTDDEPDEQPQIKQPPIRRLYWLSGAAATVLIGMLTVLWLLNGKPQTVYQQLTANSATPLTETYNTTGKPLVVKLQDGTAITLQNHARISFPANFDHERTRTVYLDGVAYFEVARNPRKPFFIYSNYIVTKVLGTHFTISSAAAGKQSEVDVSSGIVAVNAFAMSNGKAGISGRVEDGVVLTRNQRVTYMLANHKLQAALNTNPQLVAGAGNFSFNYTRFDQAVNAIQNGYGIDLIYDEKALAGKRVTANLDSTTIYQKLEVLCKMMNCHYEVMDRKIYISQLVRR